MYGIQYITQIKNKIKKYLVTTYIDINHLLPKERFNYTLIDYIPPQPIKKPKEQGMYQLYYNPDNNTVYWELDKSISLENQRKQRKKEPTSMEKINAQINHNYLNQQWQIDVLRDTISSKLNMPVTIQSDKQTINKQSINNLNTNKQTLKKETTNKQTIPNSFNF